MWFAGKNQIAGDFQGLRFNEGCQIVLSESDLDVFNRINSVATSLDQPWFGKLWGDLPRVAQVGPVGAALLMAPDGDDFGSGSGNLGHDPCRVDAVPRKEIVRNTHQAIGTAESFFPTGFKHPENKVRRH